jgi:LmbE family N-acetylglucosaminyl deacetylase
LNILAIIAHPDDEVLGSGGTLRKLANQGHDVYTCVLCAAADARHGRPPLDVFREEVAEAHRIIGIKDTLGFEFENIKFNVIPHLSVVKAVEEALLRFTPEWIFTHHPGDLNVDHRVCYEATMAAVRLPQRMSTDLPSTMIKKIFLMEVLSSTDWTSAVDIPFRSNCHVDISDSFEDKMRALRCYANALKPDPHSRSEVNIEAHARLRGAEVNVAMAEAFFVVRDLIL